MMGTRYARKARSQDVPPTFMARLRGEPMPENAGLEGWIASAPDVDATYFGERSVRDWWLRVRDSLLAEWIREHPGTRPPAWWEMEAPQWTDPTLPERIQKRLSAPRRIMIDGELVEPSPPGMFIDHQYCGLWTSPPWRTPMDGEVLTLHPVESQAAYLVRHGLLSAREADQLGDVPEVEDVPVDLEAYGLELDEPEPWEDK